MRCARGRISFERKSQMLVHAGIRTFLTATLPICVQPLGSRLAGVSIKITGSQDRSPLLTAYVDAAATTGKSRAININ